MRPQFLHPRLEMLDANTAHEDMLKCLYLIHFQRIPVTLGPVFPHLQLIWIKTGGESVSSCRFSRWASPEGTSVTPEDH